MHPGCGGHSGGNAYRQLYRQLLHGRRTVRLHSRWGDCYDNAPAESQWSRPKTEVLELREWPVFADLANVKASVANCFDCCSHERLHSHIDYKTPYHTPRQLL